MCGFCGIINFESSNQVEVQQLKRMNNTIQHRGPDDEGYFVESNVGFGFRRLSIIDLKSGHQPMSDLSGSIWIVFNGEIYNFHQIKKQLLSLGHKFKTNSDTEVIINAYKEYGVDCVKLFRGMFAFTIWDKRNNFIFLARDRFGIKPLFYMKQKDGIIFASELKSILSIEYSKREISLQAIDSYFTYGYILAPLTIYNDIHKLPPAHYLTIDLGKNGPNIKIVKYWNPTFNVDKTISFKDYLIMVKEKFFETVSTHMISDVPIGAFLSGGIDSNSVVAAMAIQSSARIRTFTIGFSDENFNESKLAKQTALKYGSDHNELIIDPTSAINIENIIGLFDEPFSDSSAIPTFFVSKLASGFVKVVLSGDGGDEFFGGYTQYQRLKRMNEIWSPNILRFIIFRSLSKVLPPRLPGKRFSYTLSRNKELFYAHFTNFWKDEKKNFYNKELYDKIRDLDAVKIKEAHLKASVTKDYLSRMMELDILTYLPDDILTKVDRASMANSLEVRVPIIDHEFFELASRIPSEFKLNSNTGKILLKEAMKNFLPRDIYLQKKRGFTIPLNKWFKDDLRDYLYSSLYEGDILQTFFNTNYIRKLQKVKNPGSLVTRMWPILVFKTWLQTVHNKR